MATTDFASPSMFEAVEPFFLDRDFPRETFVVREPTESFFLAFTASLLAMEPPFYPPSRSTPVRWNV